MTGMATKNCARFLEIRREFVNNTAHLTILAHKLSSGRFRAETWSVYAPHITCENVERQSYHAYVTGIVSRRLK